MIIKNPGEKILGVIFFSRHCNNFFMLRKKNIKLSLWSEAEGKLEVNNYF